MSASGLLLLNDLLLEQRTLRTPVMQIAEWQESGSAARRFEHLIPLSKPGVGEQYAFEVNLDACTGCKACVVACHSLNGLDENESWRDCGSLVSEEDSTIQTITTACHHCADPACANGCPVLAYDKDEDTGIVRHLDDQCIGCSYCQMKCPYDVPKWNVKRGIVRKCDMCHGRLAAGEAPACVQACPNEAIKIRVVSKTSTHHGAPIVPGAVSSDYTQPTTRYLGELHGRPVNDSELRIECAHAPLAFMLVLTQFSVGLLGWMAVFGMSFEGTLVAAIAGNLGIVLSVAHLGQPLKAWRAFLGWRKSWLSREIIAFGPFAPLLGLLVVTQHVWVLWAALAVGIVAVACSVMVYADTRRAFWTTGRTSLRFFGTALSLGASFHGVPSLTVALLVMDLASSFRAWRNASVPWHRSARIMFERLLAWSVVRTLLVLLACFIPLGWVASLCAAFLERLVFFKACVAHRMPGN
jgi:formate dehydrogenase iron-sulfur subunit